ncbi:MAG: hypothetical protein IKD06_03815 [Clostridia bacterium]|nr:hypothetical protein [Clostridia bacterium]
MLFRKRNAAQKALDEGTRLTLERMHNQAIRYVCQRQENGEEKILAKGGCITVQPDCVEFCCGTVIFEGEREGMRAAELMSGQGVVVTARDRLDGLEKTVIAYYVYHRK